MSQFKSQGHLQQASVHPLLAVLPHLYDKKTVKDVLAAKAITSTVFATKHQMLTDKYGSTDSDTTSDLIGKLMDKGHAFLEPDA